jgi:hypothetical protein
MAPSAMPTETQNLSSGIDIDNGNPLPVVRMPRVRSCASVKRLDCIAVNSC